MKGDYFKFGETCLFVGSILWGQVTNVQTTKATLTDKEALPEIQAELEQCDLSPETQVVDAGYVTAKQIVDSHDKYGIDCSDR